MEVPGGRSESAPDPGNVLTRESVSINWDQKKPREIAGLFSVYGYLVFEKVELLGSFELRQGGL